MWYYLQVLLQLQVWQSIAALTANTKSWRVRQKVHLNLTCSGVSTELTWVTITVTLNINRSESDMIWYDLYHHVVDITLVPREPCILYFFMQKGKMPRYFTQFWSRQDERCTGVWSHRFSSHRSEEPTFNLRYEGNSCPGTDVSGIALKNCYSSCVPQTDGSGIWLRATLPLFLAFFILTRSEFPQRHVSSHSQTPLREGDFHLLTTARTWKQDNEDRHAKAGHQ